MKTLLAAAIALTSVNFSVVQASPFESWMDNDKIKPQILIYHPEVPEYKIACYGCLSRETGRPRTNYVRPHINNGRYVEGYWRS